MTELKYRREQDSLYKVQIAQYDSVVSQYQKKDELSSEKNRNYESIISALEKDRHWYDKIYVAYPLGVITTVLTIIVIK